MSAHVMKKVVDFMGPAEADGQKVREAIANLMEVTESPYAEVLGEGIPNLRERMQRVVAMRTQEVGQGANDRLAALKEKGSANDICSHELGVRLYVTKEAAEHFAARAGRSYGIEAEDVGNDLFLITLPQGAWAASGGGIQCFEYGAINGGEEGVEPKDAENPFTFAYGDVIRMEGLNDNSLWQNWSFNWDGSIRE